MQSLGCIFVINTYKKDIFFLCTNKYIADTIEINKSNIGPELKMNSYKRSGKYSCDLAD